MFKNLKVYAAMTITTWAPFTVISFLNTELPWKMWLPFDYNKNQFISATLIWQQSMIFIPFTVSFLFVFPSILLNLTVGLTEENWLESGRKEEKCDIWMFFRWTRQTLEIVEMKEDKALKELLVYIEIQLKIKKLVDGISDIFDKVIWIFEHSDIVHDFFCFDSCEFFSPLERSKHHCSSSF